MGKNLVKIAGPLLAASLAAGCANGSVNLEDLKYSARGVIGAPASFVIGSLKDMQRDPAEGTYNLTGRAVSEAGRVVNGAFYPATKHKYEAELGSEKIHPMADNNAVKMAGWGAVVLGPTTSLSYLESTLTGLGLGFVVDYFTQQKK